MIDSLTLNDWHPVRLSDEVTEKPLKTRLLGTEITIKRNPAGELSGSIENPVEKCGEFTAVEKYGFVWVSLGRPASSLFTLPEFDDGLGRRFVPWGAIRVRTSAPRMIENFVDQAHFAFVHTGILGAEPHTKIFDYVVEPDDEKNELWASECRVIQPKPTAVINEPRETNYRYRIVRPWIALFYKSSLIHPDRENISGLFVQQMEEELCIAHPFAYIFAPEKSQTSLLHYSQEIFGQDRPILNNQEPKKLPLALDAEKPTRADRLSVTFRRWLRDNGVSYGVIT